MRTHRRVWPKIPMWFVLSLVTLEGHAAPSLLEFAGSALPPRAQIFIDEWEHAIEHLEQSGGEIYSQVEFACAFTQALRELTDQSSLALGRALRPLLRRLESLQSIYDPYLERAANLAEELRAPVVQFQADPSGSLSSFDPELDPSEISSPSVFITLPARLGELLRLRSAPPSAELVPLLENYRAGLIIQNVLAQRHLSAEQSPLFLPEWMPARAYSETSRKHVPIYHPDTECAICCGPLGAEGGISVLGCYHCFCRNCLESWVLDEHQELRPGALCPSCGEPIAPLRRP